MMVTPAISIILPVYNGQRYLSEALDAILAQTFTDFELIIVDDCSTDATPAIIAQYAKRDARIRVIRNEINLKLPASLNVGHHIARGNFFTWTSDDNNPHSNWLEILVKPFVSNDVDIVYSNYAGIDEEGKASGVKSTLPPLSELLWQNAVGASFLYTRKVFSQLNGYDEGLFLLEDYDFWVRAYLYGFKFLKIEDSVYNYRRHEGALSSSVPQDNVNIPYRVNIRKLFKSATPEEIFKSRTTLLYNGRHILPKQTLMILFWEALLACPRCTLQAVFSRGGEFFRRGN